MSVFKPFNRAKTKRVVSPIETDTALEGASVSSIVWDFVDNYRAEVQRKNDPSGKKGLKKIFAEASYSVHYYLEDRGAGRLLLTWGSRLGQDPTWVAQVDLLDANPHGTVVRSQIIQWTEKDGEILAVHTYDYFLEELVREIRHRERV